MTRAEFRSTSIVGSRAGFRSIAGLKSIAEVGSRARFRRSAGFKSREPSRIQDQIKSLKQSKQVSGVEQDSGA